MKLNYDAGEDYICVSLKPQRGGALHVDVSDKASIDADNMTGDELLWTKFKMYPGGRPATISYKGQSCHIRYGEDKKVYLSGDLPVAPYYNGLDPREIERMDGKWPEHLVIE